MDCVAQKAEVENHDFPGSARALEKLCRVGSGHREKSSANGGANKFEPRVAEKSDRFVQKQP
jgi:hypothetical protein